MDMPQKTTGNPDVLAWDIDGIPERGAVYQPWRAFWPPKNPDRLPADELAAKPWLTWKRDAAKPNEKPWYSWVNIFNGEVDKPCQMDADGVCSRCFGVGCVCRLFSPLRV